MKRPITPPGPSRSHPVAPTDPRRTGVGSAPQPSTLPEAEVTGQPGEEVLGGADGVPATPDETPKQQPGKPR